MKKTVFLYGVIAGLIATSIYIGQMLLGKAGEMDFKNGMLYGYTLMILGFSMIFVATKITRDRQGNGTISFGKAFLVGLYITLVASTVYVIIWSIDYNFFFPDFSDKYAAYTIGEMKTAGATLKEIANTQKEMDEFREMYKNPLFFVLLTYMEIVPVGLLVSLISAAIFRKRTANLPS